MTQPPTGVFVRLPLSEDRAHVFLGESSHTWDEFNGASDALAFEAGLIAIGTLVTGGDAPVFHQVSVLTKAGVELVSVVRQSDHQAALAAAQAEIVRLRESAELARESIKAGSPMKAAYALEEALKGPEA